jgi:hypothetical protein
MVVPVPAHGRRTDMDKAMATMPAPAETIARESDRHRAVAAQAAEAAANVLPLFEAHRPGDARPGLAIAALRGWIAGERALGMAEVRRLSLDAHAAARDCADDAARHAARAAGQAIATWHVPAHGAAACAYAAKAIGASGRV